MFIIKVEDLIEVKEELFEFNPALSDEENLLRKTSLKNKAEKLRKSREYKQSIVFLQKLIINSYFINDYYPYRQICIATSRLKDFQTQFNTIKTLINNEIYCTDYQHLWFKSKLIDLKEKLTENQEIDDLIEKFDKTYSNNKEKANEPIMLADRINIHYKYVFINKIEKYEWLQKVYEIQLIGSMLKNNKEYEKAVDYYWDIINNGKILVPSFFEQLYYCYKRLNDYEGQLKAIDAYFLCDNVRTKGFDEKFNIKREVVEQLLEKNKEPEEDPLKKIAEDFSKGLISQEEFFKKTQELNPNLSKEETPQKIPKALLMSVGTTSGAIQEDIDNMVSSLLKSVFSANPDTLVLIGSPDSVSTVESMKKQYLKDTNYELNFTFIEIENVDSFKDYYEAFLSQINQLKDTHNITIDYTSGTKNMSMAAAFAGVLNNHDLVFISGKRENGKIVPGTQEVRSQNFFEIYDQFKVERIKNLFNNNRFESAEDIIDTLSHDVNKEIYHKLFKTYAAFDSVDYDKAHELMDVSAFVREWPELKQVFGNNNGALKYMNGDGSDKPKYILASMLNNARRRADDFKYDDAIARLYRALELIAQIRLEEYGIDTSDVDINKLKEAYGLDVSYYEALAEEGNGTVKISLVQDYYLLNELGDDLGKYYKENEFKILGTISLRNNSILAHGLESKSKEEYERFNNLLLDVSKVLINDIDHYIEKSKFPEFKI